MCAHQVQTGLRLVCRDWHKNHLSWKWTAKLCGATASLPYLFSAVCFGASKTNFLIYLVHIYSPTYKMKLFIPMWNIYCYCNSDTQSFILQLWPLRLLQIQDRSVFLSSAAGNLYKLLQHRKGSLQGVCKSKILWNDPLLNYTAVLVYENFITHFWYIIIGLRDYINKQNDGVNTSLYQKVSSGGRDVRQRCKTFLQKSYSFSEP